MNPSYRKLLLRLAKEGRLILMVAPPPGLVLPLPSLEVFASRLLALRPTVRLFSSSPTDPALVYLKGKCSKVEIYSLQPKLSK